jgi:hypothetical protein
VILENKMPELRNYNLDIEIDESDLEGEWLTHPSLFLHYSKILANAIKILDEEKLRLDWIAANIDLDVRKNWKKKYGFETKPAENAIKNTILISKKYMAQQRVCHQKTKIVNNMKGVKTAFEHKKHALGNLVTMQVAGFHSEPRNQLRDLKKVVNIVNHNKHKEGLSETMKNRRTGK